LLHFGINEKELLIHGEIRRISTLKILKGKNQSKKTCFLGQFFRHPYRYCDADHHVDLCAYQASHPPDQHKKSTYDERIDVSSS